MKKHLIRSVPLFLFLIASFLCVSWVTMPCAANDSTHPKNYAQELQDDMNRYTQKHNLSGMVVWIDSPILKFAGASGYANLADKTVMQPDAVFRIGSITKMFTATIILQLAEEGKLNLDDLLSKWLPKMAAALPYGDQIRLRQLLNHTSGIYNYTDNPAYLKDEFASVKADQQNRFVVIAKDLRTPAEVIVTYTAGQKATFAPGKDGEWSSLKWSYSNTGFILLGLVIETVTGQSLVQVYHERILDPLGMTRTYLDGYETPSADLVHGYNIHEDVRYDMREVSGPGIWSDGALVSAAPDLILFARALFSGRLFHDPLTLPKMLSRVPDQQYGLGIEMKGDLRGHRGFVEGFSAALFFDPAQDAVIVELCNTFNPRCLLMLDSATSTLKLISAAKEQ